MGMLEAEDRTDLLVAAFERLTGAPPTVLGHAPGRVNLMGEHTDYNAGLVLPVALPHGTRAAARARDDGRVRLLSLQQDDAFVGDLADCGPGGHTGWAGYAAGVLWALSREGLPVPGVDLVVDSTVPLGAGLSSSAALECAVGAAVGAGALGARMTGGGFGGSAVAWVPAEGVDRVVTAIDDRFAGAGFRSPQHLLATPSAGAAWTSVDD